MAADAIALAGRPRLATVPAAAEIIDRFRAALAARDIVPPERIIADGSIHRCDAAGKNGKGDAAYLLHMDGIPAGGLENWRDDKGWESWRFDIGRALTPAELDALRRKAEAASARRTEEAAKRHTAAREVAARIWQAARPGEDGGRRTPAGRGDQSGAAGWPGMIFGCCYCGVIPRRPAGGSYPVVPRLSHGYGW